MAEVANEGQLCCSATWGGRKRSLLGQQEIILGEVARQPDITLEELCQRVVEAGGAKVSSKTMCLELKRLGLGRKKSRSTPQNETRRGLGS
jgi:transposase